MSRDKPRWIVDLLSTLKEPQDSFKVKDPNIVGAHGDGAGGKNDCRSKGLNGQIETLSQELEEMKKQLTDKETLIKKYQIRIEELGSSIEGERGDDCNKLLENYFAKTENICDQDRNVQPSVYRNLETTRTQLNQVEKEVIQLKKKLKEAESSIKRLRSDLVASEKNAREMRAALTAEVAEKHDQILALRREVNQLEEQLRQADMQTHFKDDIIKELRKEVKVARSKETLVEVLGIKERSLSHLEHLTEQLEEKNQVISCLKQQLTQGSADLLYRVRQQVDWFTENVSQQCSQGNCSEEFKKCITTMLEELKESIECCHLGPPDTDELSKGSIKHVSALQKSLEKSKGDLCQSWDSISKTVHQMNKTDLSSLVDQWKKGLCKQKCLQMKLQEIVRSIISITTSSNGNVEAISKSMGSLQSLLLRFTDELNNQPCGRSFTGWLKNLHCVVTELISKIQEITQVISDIRSGDDETHSDLVSKMELIDTLQLELNETLCTELKAYENLCRKEKLQRGEVDSLLATVLHHQEIWNQQTYVTDELLKETLRLSNNMHQNVQKQATQGPIWDRSTYLKSFVSKISADIRNSLCDIEQRQNEVGHLELDLSSVILVLESAQQEIEEISMTCNTQDVRRKMNVLLLKLKKQISNALMKANNLVNTYANTKKEFISSSERILQLQKEWETLEQEVRCQWTQLSQDFKKATRKEKCAVCPNEADVANRDKKDLYQQKKNLLCPNQAVVATCEQKVKKLNETLDSYFRERQKNKCGETPILNQYKCLQRALQKEDAAIQKVKGNVMELKSNIKEREKLTETQEKTICVLQNSLKRLQKENEDLHKTIRCLEVKKRDIELESTEKIKELEFRILKLHNCSKKYEDASDLKDDDLVEKLQIATIELASLAGSLHDDCRSAHLKITDLLDQMSDIEKKHYKTEEALRIVIANLKESMCKEQRKLCEIQKKNKSLEDELEKFKTSTNRDQVNTISLQNSLEASQKEVEKLCKKVKYLESKKAETENEYKEQIQKLEQKICELQNNMKTSEDSSVFLEDDSVRCLQNANLELAILAGHLQEECRKAENKLSELHVEFRNNESKHHKSEAALQLVIANLKEVICKEKKKCCEIEKENKMLQEQMKELQDCSKNVSESNQEALDKICDLKKQVKCWSKQVSDLEDKIKNLKEKLCKSHQHEKELEAELCSKDTKCKEELCKKQKEINELKTMVQSLTDRMNESKTDLDDNRMKTCEMEIKLKNILDAYEELKSKEREKETQVEKLQMALTQLSNKFVSRRLDTGASQCVRHYQEECAKYEALYNTTACKLRSKEVEVSSFKQELERLRHELDHTTVTTTQQEDVNCPFLIERVHQLSKELQVAHSCQNSYETMIKDLRDKNSKKEEENFLLKMQIKQISLQRDSALLEVEETKKEINRLKMAHSNLESTTRRLEQNNAHTSERLDLTPAHLQPNIELQREISTALTSQLRGVKQKLHETKHDYKLLQAAYEELNHKYTMLQRGERDLDEQIKEIIPAVKPAKKCQPCLAKSSKSVNYIKMPEGMDGQNHMDYLSHSKSWHKMDDNEDLDWKERGWKRRLQ